MKPSRQLWVIAHRWAGLTIALFLVVAGFTGTFMAFYEELHEATAPRFTLATLPSPDAKPLDPLVLRERAEKLTGATVTYVDLLQPPRHAALFYAEPRAGQPPLGYDEIALNPYTGEEQGRRTWGAISEGWFNIMPFIYQLHYKLALGDWGLWAFGIAALIWTLDCFVGFYLTLPRARPRWWAHWRKSWHVKLPAPSNYRLNFDLHRAGGLWAWPVLLVFAWSSVGFNLREVYNPVMRAITGEVAPYDAAPDRATPLTAPKLNWHTARDRLAEIAAARAAREGFTVESWHAMYFDSAKGLYVARFRSDRDVWDKGGRSEVAIDADSGKFIWLSLPSGQQGLTTFESWLFGLHMGKVLGLPYRVFVSALGLLITMLSVTGVVIWMRKRAARLLGRHRLHRLDAYQPIPAAAE